jgi:hypothetical protein
MMNRRHFMLALAATLGTRVEAAALTPAKNVVLVHGLLADGSCWIDVIPLLQST